MGGVSSVDELGDAFSEFQPWLVLQTMPFHAFMEDANLFARGAELALVIAAIGVVRWRLVSEEERILWWFYVGNFVFYPFYKYDPQYYMPMFVVLPALLTIAMGRLASWRSSAGFLAMGAVAVVLLTSGWTLHGQTDRQLHPDSKHFRSIQSELAVVEALTELGVSEDELYGRTHFAQKSEDTRLAYLFKAFGRFGEGTEGRCLRVEGADSPAEGAVEASMAAGRYRIDLLRLSGEPCASNVTPVREEFVRWDLDRWELVQR
jgi:hypothetical protein